MRFKKPFKAVPINPDPGYLERQKNRQGGAATSAKSQSNQKSPPLQKPRPIRSGQVIPFRQKRTFIRKRARRRKGDAVKTVVIWAAVFGATIGVGSVALEPDARARFRSLAIELHLIRARELQPGDYWSQCSEAKAAGTYPIWASEPGYRPELDRDGDGIACEPYR